jgi:hypothetical protein
MTGDATDFIDDTGRRLRMNEVYFVDDGQGLDPP